jgi:hypothetical protein
MDAAAPEAAESRVVAEAGAAVRKRAWWRVKIPTSVIMTLVGIALTAWLLPAFTRQWDDRQKERELKAAVASDAASMTARAVLKARETGTPAEIVEATLLSDWQIESRLRLYFPASVGAAWDLYSYGIHLLVNAPFVQTRAAYLKASRTVASVTPHVAARAAPLLLQARVSSARGDDTGGPDPEWATTILDRLGAVYPDVVQQAKARPIYGGLPLLEADVESLESALADEIVSAHLTGYSTTRRDLIHDLLPF